MDDAQRRRQILANSAYLEVRSQALIAHSQELIARAQRMRERQVRLLEHCSDLWFRSDAIERVPRR